MMRLLDAARFSGAEGAGGASAGISAVSTVERWPGVRVDRGSSVHVMVRHTGIVEELALGDAGLVYDDVEPWAVLPHRDGALRFAGDLDETCASIELAIWQDFY